MLQRSLGRCAPPRHRNSSPSKGDTSPLLLKNIVSEAAFGLLNRGLAIMTKPDKASSRPISTGEPTQTLALFHFGSPSVVEIGDIDPMDQVSVTLSHWPLGPSGSLRAKAHLTRIGCALRTDSGDFGSAELPGSFGLLAAWRRRTARCRQLWLRSPSIM